MKKIITTLVLMMPMLAFAAEQPAEEQTYRPQSSDVVITNDAGPGPEEEQLYMPDIQTDGDGTYEDTDEYGD